jgi:hypothetical protein
MSSEEIKISWFGRCCFLVENGNIKILFDPYDEYFWGINLGKIPADIEIISSTWHDHGNIGASPKAMIYSYAGKDKNDSIDITGIEAMEDRGTPTVVFNVKVGPFSITNFADFGPDQEGLFIKNLKEEDKEILKSTNIAFIRPSIDEQGIHNECALNYCDPTIIIPEHYFPVSFIEKQIPENEKENFLKPNIVVDEMIQEFKYPVMEIDDYSITISKDSISRDKILFKLLKIHPQVKYNLN